jgi:RecA/RadA recombinase
MAAARRPAAATATPAVVDARAAEIEARKKAVNRNAIDMGMTTADRPLVTTLAERHEMFGKPISTGSILLDFLLGGGWPRGCTVKIWGPEGCTSANTWIDYETRTPGGKRQSHKGGTIEQLYRRFHKLPLPCGKGQYHRKQTAESDFYVPSIDDKDCVVMNRVMNVIDSGVKQTWTVVTVSGNHITATDNHEFYMGDGEYRRLDHLQVGDTLFSHEKHRLSTKRVQKVRPTVCVKYHSSGKLKIVQGFTYYQIYKHHLVYEAMRNGLTYEEYVEVLNTKTLDYIDSLWIVPKGHDIHHKDGDIHNNALGNLEMIDHRSHAQMHWSQKPHNLMRRVVEDRILSITPAGEMQVYDIVCAEPYRNFIANGIAVHNCGKSNLAMLAASIVVKAGGYVLWMQAEEGDPWQMAQTYGITLNDPHFIVYYCQGSGEQAIYGLKAFLMDGRIPAHLLDLVVLDSAAGLEPKDLIDYDTKKNAAGKVKGPEGSVNPGRVAAMYAGMFRFMHSTKALGTAAFILISQARVDVGGYGTPEISVGGRATDHAARLVIKMKRKTGEGMVKVNAAGEQVGHTNELTFTKDGYRHRLQGRKASFAVYYGKGIDNPTSYFDLMLLSGGIIKATSSRYDTSPTLLELIQENKDAYKTFAGAPKAKAAFKDVVFLRAVKQFLENYSNSDHQDDVTEADAEDLVEDQTVAFENDEAAEPLPLIDDSEPGLLSNLEE